MPKTSEMIQSKFLRKEDFDEDRVMVIKGVKLEDMPGDQGDQKWVLYFREEAKGMALNVTTIRVLEQAYGDDTDHWVGNKVMVYVDPNVSFGGRIVGGLRLRTPKVKTLPKPAQRPRAPIATEPPPDDFEGSETSAGDPEFDDSIPF